MDGDNTAGAITRKMAIAILVLLSMGSLATSLDLVTPYLHPFPAVLAFRGASTVAHAIWFSAGVIGVLAIGLLVRRKRYLALMGVLAFIVAYVLGAQGVWFSFTIGCWLAIAALVLASFAVARRAA